MNILQVHNRYRIQGGEWTVVQQEQQLLSRRHNVYQFLVDNQTELSGFAGKLKLLFQTRYNRMAREQVKQVLKEQEIELMHVHNFFPVLSPSVFDAAAELGIPSVMTLHNYRLVDPGGLLYHNGKPDERSLRSTAWRSVPSGTYRNSMLQTAVVARMIEYHKKQKTWHRVPDLFIALTEFSKQKFVEGGIPEERIRVKPNFVADPFKNREEAPSVQEESPFFLYAGRISEEKGVEDLVRCWTDHTPPARLCIAGDGPLKTSLEKKTRGNGKVHWLGQISQPELYERMKQAEALIFPSRWYEGMPMTILEAKALGCPVISSNTGNQADLVHDGKDGLHFQTGSASDLSEIVRHLLGHPTLKAEMVRHSRNDYVTRFTPEQNITRLEEIYEEARGKESAGYSNE